MAEKEVVVMEDGTEVVFSGAKKKLIKNTVADESGAFNTTLYFRNGRILTFTAPESLLDQFAMHGIDQKLGDSIAGIVDTDDAVLAMEETITRLQNGEWAVKRKSSELAGGSILLRALVEYSGQDVEKVKEFLSAKTHAEKFALRKNAGVKAIVDRLEDEKAARLAEKDTGKPAIDSSALLSELS